MIALYILVLIAKKHGECFVLILIWSNKDFQFGGASFGWKAIEDMYAHISLLEQLIWYPSSTKPMFYMIRELN